MHTQHNQDGITLLITLLLMGVLLGVSASLLNITLKQYQISGISLASEVAFQAANAGVECILYHDLPRDQEDPGPFMVNGDGSQVGEATISCMGGVSSSDIEPSNNNTVVSGEEQRFRFSWGTNPVVCTEVSIYKFYSTTASQQLIVEGRDLRPGDPCLAGNVCTVVKSRGYNVTCNQITTGSRVVEREYTQVY